MDKQSMGARIAALRRTNGMTQLSLAEQLSVSDKTVSKWENGQGYPDITQLPSIASLFGVTIDYLMLGEKKGIAIAGNMVTDIVKNIERYPEIGMLAHVSEATKSVGGCPPNTGIDLAKIDGSLPVSVLGRVGFDENGRFIIAQLQKNGINVDGVVYSNTTPTSCDDVMSMPTGERTFFHQKGANAEFCPEDVDISKLNCDIFHIGYIRLLDQFDAEDPVYGTVMARFLRDLQKAGIRTSFDVVSDSDPDSGKKIIPALKYANYAVMNEIECESVWGIPSRNPDGSLNVEGIRQSMQRMGEYGVKNKIVVHAKEAAFLWNVESGEFSAVGSLILPDEEIRGSVGAGDAFCAGCLYAFYHGYTDGATLEFASGAAACSLFAANAVDGMRSRNEIMELCKKYERRTV